MGGQRVGHRATGLPLERGTEPGGALAGYMSEVINVDTTVLHTCYVGDGQDRRGAASDRRRGRVARGIRMASESLRNLNFLVGIAELAVTSTGEVLATAEIEGEP